MFDYRRVKRKGGCYFFTVTPEGRRTVLTDDAIRGGLRQGIVDARRTLPFAIDAWVLLPDHLHCLWRLPENDANYGARWAILKRAASRRAPFTFAANASRRKRKENALWQRRFWEHLIRDQRDFDNHFDYIHSNPVKHGYVERVIDWPYSTFHRHAAADLSPPDWGAYAGDWAEQDYGE